MKKLLTGKPNQPKREITLSPLKREAEGRTIIDSLILSYVIGQGWLPASSRFYSKSTARYFFVI